MVSFLSGAGKNRAGIEGGAGKVRDQPATIIRSHIRYPNSIFNTGGSLDTWPGVPSSLAFPLKLSGFDALQSLSLPPQAHSSLAF